MSTLDSDALYAGLLDCGGPQRGQTFLQAHARDITPAFIDRVRSTAVAFMAHPDASTREIAPKFAQLAVVAAILLGDDGEKGLSHLVLAQVLLQRGEHEGAARVLNTAEPLLERAGLADALLACLVAHGDALRSLGRAKDALDAFGAAHARTRDDDDRAALVEDMQQLALDAGDVPLDDGLCGLVRRWVDAGLQKPLTVQRADAPEQKLSVCKALAAGHAGFADPALRERSFAQYLADKRCIFFTGADTVHAGDDAPPSVHGLACVYGYDFNDRHLLGIEGVVALKPDADLLGRLLDGLLTLARDVGCDGVCIAPGSFADATRWREFLAPLGAPDLQSITLWGGCPGVRSAFIEAPDGRAFDAVAITVRAAPQVHDFDGARIGALDVLYRGEGRLRHDATRQQWRCSDVAALARHVFNHGFRSRIDGRFDGTIPSQLLHQGYVDQATVSLSAAFDVCARYATQGHTRSGGGLVFTVDVPTLLCEAPVFDSLATLQKACPWTLTHFFDLLVRVMHVIDGGTDDVTASGRFLQRCHDESRRRVLQHGGGTLFGPAIDWPAFLGPDLHARLCKKGIKHDDLDTIISEFEAHWLVETGQCASMDSIHEGDDRIDTMRLSRAYFAAFDDVGPRLRERWQLNRFSTRNSPGWDLSPLGYVTKTIRDREYFSGGDVPGKCIVEAVHVDRDGVPQRTIANRRFARC